MVGDLKEEIEFKKQYLENDLDSNGKLRYFLAAEDRGCIVGTIAQAENESRSDNTKWGVKQHAAQGTSKLYNRKCFGYKHDENGNLIIDEGQAAIVRLIYDLYLGGNSIVSIIWGLEKRSIKLPQGKTLGRNVQYKQC